MRVPQKMNEYLFVQWLMGFQTVGRDVVLAQSQNVSLLLVLSPNLNC